MFLLLLFIVTSWLFPRFLTIFHFPGNHKSTYKKLIKHLLLCHLFPLIKEPISIFQLNSFHPVPAYESTQQQHVHVRLMHSPKSQGRHSAPRADRADLQAYLVKVIFHMLNSKHALQYCLSVKGKDLILFPFSPQIKNNSFKIHFFSACYLKTCNLQKATAYTDTCTSGYSSTILWHSLSKSTSLPLFLFCPSSMTLNSIYFYK